MVNVKIKEELEKQLDKLPAELQKQVLDFAQGLACTPPTGMPGKHLLSFAGGINEDDAQAMSEAIEQECETSRSRKTKPSLKSLPI